MVNNELSFPKATLEHVEYLLKLDPTVESPDLNDLAEIITKGQNPNCAAVNIDGRTVGVLTSVLHPLNSEMTFMYLIAYLDKSLGDEEADEILMTISNTVHMFAEMANQPYGFVTSVNENGIQVFYPFTHEPEHYPELLQAFIENTEKHLRENYPDDN